MSYYVSNTSQATAVVKDSAGVAIPGAQPSAWISSAPTVASVSATGLVAMVGVGTTNISATLPSPTGLLLTSNVLSVVVSPTPASIVISLPPGK